MRRALGISIAAALIVAAACEGFEEGAGSDGPDAGDGGDASTTTDAPAGDAPLDAAADGPTVPFCSTVDASFCWSFDDESSGSALYGPKFLPKGAPVSLTQMAKSAPNALLARGDGGSGPTMLTMQVPATTSLTCKMALYIEEISNNTEVLAFDVGSRYVSFWIQPIDPMTSSVKSALLYERSSPQKLRTGLPNLPMKQWLEITLAAQVASNGFLLAASAGDAGPVVADFSDAGTNIFDAPPSVDVGFFVQYGGTGAVRVDDVTCDWN